MAHNSDLGGDSSGEKLASVDERREHAPVLSESAAFEEFDRWMDVSLGGLVERWIHAAAPRAAQQRHWARRFDAGRQAG